MKYSVILCCLVLGSISCKNENPTPLPCPESTICAYQVFPNPAEDYFNLMVTSNIEAIGRVELISLSGQLMMEETIELESGENLFEYNITQLDKGVYSIKIDAGDEEKVSRLIKR